MTDLFLKKIDDTQKLIAEEALMLSEMKEHKSKRKKMKSMSEIIKHLRI